MLGWSALEATYSLLLHLLDISFTAIVYCDHAVWLLVGVTDILTTLEKCIVDSNDDIIYCNVSTQVHVTISLSLSLSLSPLSVIPLVLMYDVTKSTAAREINTFT